MRQTRKATSRKTPIASFGLYDCRHTFLTRLGEANTDPFSIQRIAGHSSIVVSQKYVHPTPERLEDAFARLESYNEMKAAEMKAKQQTKEAHTAVNKRRRVHKSGHSQKAGLTARP